MPIFYHGTTVRHARLIQANGVADLQKGFLKAGKHRVTWRSTGLSSGTYLIRLHTDRHVETRKALFLQ